MEPQDHGPERAAATALRGLSMSIPVTSLQNHEKTRLKPSNGNAGVNLLLEKKNKEIGPSGNRSL